MKERPILFNTAMVQAILAGRKTQTRRVMSRSDADSVAFMGGSDDEGKEFEFAGIHYGQMVNDDGKLGDAQWLAYCTEYPEEGSIPIGQGFGAIGDRLWVRETWSVVSHSHNDEGLMVDWVPDRPAIEVREMPFGKGYYSGHIIYAADGLFEWGDDDGNEDGRSYWKPSIHMPRAACRIILEITGVRVERLQDISEGDALSEGIPELLKCESPADEFRMIWEQTGGDWNANPWVWVIEFKVLTTNGVVPEVAA